MKIVKNFTNHLSNLDVLTAVTYLLVSLSFHTFYHYTIPLLLIVGFIQFFRALKNKISINYVLESYFYILIYSVIFFRSAHTAILILNLFFHTYFFFKEKKSIKKNSLFNETLIIGFFIILFLNQLIFEPYLKVIETYVFLFFYPLLFVFLKKRKELIRLEIALKTFIMSVFITSLILIITHLFAGSFHFKTNTFFANYFDLSHVYYGLFLGAACSFICILIHKNKQNKQNWRWLMLFAFFILLMIYSGARMALIATIFIVGMLLFNKSNLLWYVKGTVTIVVASTLLYTSYTFIPRAKQDVLYVKNVYNSVMTNNKQDLVHNSWRNMYQRFLVTKYTIQEIKENVWLGIGIANVKKHLGEQIHKDGFKYFEFINPHNQLLHFWLGLGIFGFVYFLYMLVVFLNQQFSNPYFWVFFILIMLTESVLVRVKGISVFFLFSLLFSMENQLKND